MSPRIAICICTYQRYDTLPLAIESALAQSLDKSEYRIIVVDNSPDHAFAEEFGKPYHQPPFLDYRIERTPGLSNARNVGCRECGTEFIAFMDDDAIASPDWLKLLLAGYDQFGPEAAAVGGRVDPMWEVPRPSWLADDMLGFVSAVDWGGTARVAGPGEWLAGTNVSFRAKMVLDAGGFDVKLGRVGDGSALLSNEEIAVAAYLRDSGKLTVYVPEASVRHLVEKRRLTQDWFRKRVVWQAVSDYMADSAAMVKRAQDGWSWCMSYFFSLPPRDRTIRGLSVALDSPVQFRQQLDVLYLYTGLMLAGFPGMDQLDAGLTPKVG